MLLITNVLIFEYLQYKPYFALAHFSCSSAPLPMFCFISPDTGAHKPRLLAPFVMNLETALLGLNNALWFCFFVSYIDMREKSVLTIPEWRCMYTNTSSFPFEELACTSPMIWYVIHGNKITFIVIVIPPFRYFPSVSSLSKHTWAIGYVHNWKVSPQLCSNNLFYVTYLAAPKLSRCPDIIGRALEIISRGPNIVSWGPTWSSGGPDINIFCSF